MPAYGTQQGKVDLRKSQKKNRKIKGRKNMLYMKSNLPSRDLPNSSHPGTSLPGDVGGSVLLPLRWRSRNSILYRGLGLDGVAPRNGMGLDGVPSSPGRGVEPKWGRPPKRIVAVVVGVRRCPFCASLIHLG